MMSSKELLTLQLGNYSNYVGTHFWNLQYDSLRSENDNTEDINHSKLFRETSDYYQPHVPRMISFDVKSSLNALKLDGTFNSVERITNDTIQHSTENDVDDNFVTYSQKEIEKNDFLLHFHSKSSSKQKDFNLDEKVKTWSDFMSYKLNENSLQLLWNRFEDDSKFRFHGLGYCEYEGLKYDIEDKLHYWVEECNSMDGFMIFTDMHDGFCGLTSKLLDELHDEYKNKTFVPFINCLPTEIPPDLHVVQCLNTALTFQSFKRHSSMFVLQSLKDNLVSTSSQIDLIPNVTYKADLPYHSSAILAAAIDSSTFPWRKAEGCDMLEICQHITQNKWKLCGNAIGFPCVKDSNDVLLFERMMSSKELYGDFITSLFPLDSTSYSKPMSQSLVFQDRCGMVIPRFDPKMLQNFGLNSDVFRGNPQNFLEFITKQLYPSTSTLSKSFYTKRKSNLCSPFSSILQSPNDGAPATMSSLFTSASFYNVLSELNINIQNIKLNKFHLLQEYGFDQDTHKELVEDLCGLADEYNLVNRFQEICN